MTFTQAARRVQKEGRAICVVCNSEILGRNKKDTLFCTKNQECKKARWRYLHHLNRGKEPGEALLRALREHTGG